jgi:hypothetical protein
MADPSFLCRPIVFDIPDRMVHPPSWLDYTPFAFWVVDALRPATFVELGCHSGNSYSSFAQAVQTLGLPTTCYGVDTWQGDPHAGTLDERVYEEWVEYHDRRFGAFSHLIRSTFDAAVERFSDASIDLLHIDGYHTAEAVSHDFDTWRSTLSDRSVVLFHDIGVREGDFGVWRVWERLRTEYPSWEFRHGHGLGVLGIGANLPAPVRWLLSRDQEEANTVRRFFARLGAAVASQYSADEARRALRAELGRRNDRFVQAASQLAAVKATNTDLQNALRTAEAQLAERDAEIAQLASARLREAERSRPTIVVVSHVGAWQPRAGNEYRLNRMLHWYCGRGYRVIFVIAPLPGDELSADAIDGTAAAFGNAIQIHRDGRIEHDLRDIHGSLQMPARAPASLSSAANDDAGSTARTRELMRIEQTFCHDPLIFLVQHVQQSLGPHILQVEYIWMSRLLPLAGSNVLKVIDTVDVFSSIDQKVSIFGLRDLVIGPDEEAEHLRRADLVLAIQEEERRELQRLAPSVPVITAGVDFDVSTDPGEAKAGRILYVGSGNQRNCKGLQDFLRLAWPRIRRAVPDAELTVVGGVAKVITGRDVPGITSIGVATDVAPFYRDASLVINPVVAGTGVKVKTLEALCHLRPVVTWPAGVEGLDPRLVARCVVGHDWYEFSNLVVDALTGRRRAQLGPEDREVIAELVSPQITYASLDAAFAEFFTRHSPAVDIRTQPALQKAMPAVAHAD